MSAASPTSSQCGAPTSCPVAASRSMPSRTTSSVSFPAAISVATNMASPSFSTANARLPVALIAGPTASGKSALAVALAKSLGNGTPGHAMVVNADASQVYADLAILSARPSDDEMDGVPHRFFGHVDGSQAHNAARWAGEARGAIAEAHAAGQVPILAGGTGLYLRTLLHGIAPVPEIDPQVRDAVRAFPVAEAHAALAVA